MRLFNFQLRILNNRVLYLSVKCSIAFALKNGIKLIANIPKTILHPRISLYLSGLQTLIVLRKFNPSPHSPHNYYTKKFRLTSLAEKVLSGENHLTKLVIP